MRLIPRAGVAGGVEHILVPLRDDRILERSSHSRERSREAVGRRSPSFMRSPTAPMTDTHYSPRPPTDSSPPPRGPSDRPEGDRWR